MKYLTLISLALSAIVAAPAQAHFPIVYTGRASTSEAVYYHGARFQCDDLPKNDSCWWRILMRSYTIGSDNMSAIADCAESAFAEA